VCVEIWRFLFFSLYFRSFILGLDLGGKDWMFRLVRKRKKEWRVFPNLNRFPTPLTRSKKGIIHDRTPSSRSSRGKIVCCVWGGGLFFWEASTDLSAIGFLFPRNRSPTLSFPFSSRGRFFFYLFRTWAVNPFWSLKSSPFHHVLGRS